MRIRQPEQDVEVRLFLSQAAKYTLVRFTDMHAEMKEEAMVSLN